MARLHVERLPPAVFAEESREARERPNQCPESINCVGQGLAALARPRESQRWTQARRYSISSRLSVALTGHLVMMSSSTSDDKHVIEMVLARLTAGKGEQSAVEYVEPPR